MTSLYHHLVPKYLQHVNVHWTNNSLSSKMWVKCVTLYEETSVNWQGASFCTIECRPTPLSWYYLRNKYKVVCSWLKRKRKFQPVISQNDFYFDGYFLMNLIYVKVVLLKEKFTKISCMIDLETVPQSKDNTQQQSNIHFMGFCLFCNNTGKHSLIKI